MFSCRQASARDIPDMVELLCQLFNIEKDFDFNPQKHRVGLWMLLQSRSRSMNYFPDKSVNPEEWLTLDEGERITLTCVFNCFTSCFFGESDAVFIAVTQVSSDMSFSHGVHVDSRIIEGALVIFSSQL